MPEAVASQATSGDVARRHSMAVGKTVKTPPEHLGRQVAAPRRRMGRLAAILVHRRLSLLPWQHVPPPIGVGGREATAPAARCTRRRRHPRPETLMHWNPLAWSLLHNPTTMAVRTTRGKTHHQLRSWPAMPPRGAARPTAMRRSFSRHPRRRNHAGFRRRDGVGIRTHQGGGSNKDVPVGWRLQVGGAAAEEGVAAGMGAAVSAAPAHRRPAQEPGGPIAR